MKLDYLPMPFTLKHSITREHTAEEFCISNRVLNRVYHMLSLYTSPIQAKHFHHFMSILSHATGPLLRRSKECSPCTLSSIYVSHLPFLLIISYC
jgi:hypothetical protein